MAYAYILIFALVLGALFCALVAWYLVHVRFAIECALQVTLIYAFDFCCFEVHSSSTVYNLIQRTIKSHIVLSYSIILMYGKMSFAPCHA
jgi:hypothetical protein